MGLPLGGYQVMKKWLSYREEALLGRPLMIEEVDYFSQVVRRIAALLLLGPDLDANYAATKSDTYAWPTTTRHLQLLERAGLVRHERRGRSRSYILQRPRLSLARGWLGWFDRPWDGS